MADKRLLDIEDLTMNYRTQQGDVRAVEDVTLSLGENETMGLVGESGCGKTTLIKAIMRILPSTCLHKNGKAVFMGEDLMQLSEEEMCRVRWRDISLISQSAMNSLDPVYKVGDQLVEAYTTHVKETSSGQAWARAEQLFELVGINPARLKDYPHQFSGGMKQRAVIAMAMVLDPALVIADEPTTALDVVIQAQILERIKAVMAEHKGAMILVTHDISVVAQTCQKVAVMYAGRLMEYGEVREVLLRPRHPYAMGLKNAFPNLLGEKKTLISIPGSPPDLISPPKGCLFAPRCPFALEVCRNELPPMNNRDGHLAACHRVKEADSLFARSSEESLWLKRNEANA